MDLLKGFSHLHHASIKFQGDKTIYVDPFKIAGAPHDADFVFCTHEHFDHLSPEDIRKVMKEGTVAVVPKENVKSCRKLDLKEVIGVEAGKDYEIAGLKFKVVPSYNLDKKFHKRKEDFLGFIITIGGADYYFAGDTDYIPEMETIKADVVFLPVGGTYTMNATEAARAANTIKPKVAVPIHFGSVVGTRADAETFLAHLDQGIQGVILLP
jgi:L-ascorbate metabolism protein UlaG (beta-lactamase superfamily)